MEMDDEHLISGGWKRVVTISFHSSTVCVCVWLLFRSSLYFFRFYFSGPLRLVSGVLLAFDAVRPLFTDFDRVYLIFVRLLLGQICLCS